MGLIMYVFSIVFTSSCTEYLELVGSDEDGKLVAFFGSVPASVFTLFKSIAGGISWHEVVQPLEKTGPMQVILFILYIFFTYFAVLNVVTAAFCQAAIDNASRDP